MSSVIPIGEPFGTASQAQAAVTTHALDEAQRKFGIPRKQADGWIRSRLAYAQYIGMATNDNGDPGRIFAYNRICLILDPAKDVVVTVYPRTVAPPSLTNPIRGIIEKELRKSKRKLNAFEKRTRLDKADIRVEIAECERRAVRTKSSNVQASCQARINALNEQLTLLDEDLRKAQANHSALLKGVTVFV
ncbi:hypothetical protein D7Z54_33160 [Salibacterium salarium]|uniref:Uncharacterized protein n=1 Tax=Salibacterium salarium TaxID=284579 RepID=A0A428MSG9_9BACI|nr:hypothetical protein [Salibacterium salarium]RSL29081.1 hypothetical protein D7Z54_33160 [Salibacterium salarium]